MPLFLDSSSAGQNFGGTPGNGELDFGIGATDAARALIQNIGLSSNSDIGTIALRMARNASQLGLGSYIELAFEATPTRGISLFSCNIFVPPEWFLFLVTTGASADDKFWNVDWRRISYSTFK